MPIISKESWDKLTQEEKEKIRKIYAENLNSSLSGKEYLMSSIFPEECLQPQPLTYEDVESKKVRSIEAKDWILEKISNHRHKGEIVIMTIDGIRVARIEDIIKQPVEGLLYDLNRDDATLGTLFRTSGDPKYINDIAMVNIVKYLMKKLKDGNKEIQAF